MPCCGLGTKDRPEHVLKKEKTLAAVTHEGAFSPSASASTSFSITSYENLEHLHTLPIATLNLKLPHAS